MSTIRENMKDLVQRLLVTKGIASEEQAYEWACGIAERMGLDGLEGDQIGRLACVILTTLKGTTTLYHKPIELPVVWINFDDLRREGVESVEVF
jgi:hypothetical protein